MTDGGIISGPTIAREVEDRNIVIEPGFDKSRINPASYDLTLGAKVAVYKEAVDVRVGRRHYVVDVNGDYRAWDESAALDLTSLQSDWLWPREACILSTRAEHEILTFDIKPTGWLLKPGIGYLMHTAERIWTTKYVPVLDGKSSLGRLFMTAHVTAGYGDPGFNGQYTLEVVVTHPVIVYPGMRFCQIRFHTYVGEHLHYDKTGHYVGDAADGPVPSMSWKQFEEERARGLQPK